MKFFFQHIFYIIKIILQLCIVVFYGSLFFFFYRLVWIFPFIYSHGKHEYVVSNHIVLRDNCRVKGFRRSRIREGIKRVKIYVKSLEKLRTNLKIRKQLQNKNVVNKILTFSMLEKFVLGHLKRIIKFSTISYPGYEF